MATVETRETADPGFYRLTAADLAALPPELPSGPVLYELDNGRLLTMPPPGYEHGSREACLTGQLFTQGQERGFGRVVCGEAGLILWRDPDRVVGMDVGFVVAANLPVRLSPEGYLETIPDLVAEILSKNDTRPYVQRKIEDYLTAGVRVVWIVDPASRTVVEHRRDVPPRTYSAGDTLAVEDVIPGLRIAVAGLFQE